VIDVATPERQNPEVIELLIDWPGSAMGVPVRHANQAIVQVVEHELNLTFFQFNPPVVIGAGPEVSKQLRGMDTIVPDCVARINMSARTAKGLIEALQNQFDEKGVLKGDEDEHHEEE
jgi:hypothetical protein